MSWYRDVKTRTNPVVYFFTSLLSPLIRRYVERLSPHMKYNLAGVRDPEASLPMNELFPPGAKDGL